VFDDGRSTQSQFDDINISRFLRTHGPTFTVDTNLSDFLREFINYLRALKPAFPELLEGASPLYVAESAKPIATFREKVLAIYVSCKAMDQVNFVDFDGVDILGCGHR
jgi:hypothetical protein